MYALQYLEKFTHEVDPFVKLISSSSSFHIKIIIKVLCEQTREANKRIKMIFGLCLIYIWFWEYCG